MPQLNTSNAPSAATPLWIIALFIALSEATAGIAAITTNGTTRLIFACFAVAFPVVVFSVFVWLLIAYAPNLYAPGQYSSVITPEIYRAGIRRDEQIVIGKAFAESVAPLLMDAGTGVSNREVVEQLARNFDAAVEAQSVSVDLDELKPYAGELSIPVTNETLVGSLLNQIYFVLSPAVKPFTYGESWLLEDSLGKVYDDIGTEWARSRGLDMDNRPIAEAGIRPGSRMRVVAKR